MGGNALLYMLTSLSPRPSSIDLYSLLGGAGAEEEGDSVGDVFLLGRIGAAEGHLHQDGQLDWRLPRGVQATAARRPARAAGRQPGEPHVRQGRYDHPSPCKRIQQTFDLI